MNTRHLVDAELLAALDFFPQASLGPEALAAVCDGMRQLSASMPVPEGVPVDVEDPGRRMMREAQRGPPMLWQDGSR